MAVKIGHASIDENGKVKSGAAGDQTKKEVCTRNWYDKGWNVILRPKSSDLAETSAKACEAGCANDKVGYDQNQRNTLNTQAKAVGYDLAKISSACECDCSAFMHVCAIAGGANLPYGSNGYTTRTMVSAFVNSGDYERLTDSKYLTSDKYLMRGDILVKEGSHTVMVLENGSEAIVTRKVDYAVEMRNLKKGCTGEDVRALQILLIGRGYSCGKCGADGDFGAATDKAVRTYQKDKGQTVDGVASKATISGLLGV